MQISRNNNFDLIRVLAALQVVYVHSSKHILGIKEIQSDGVFYYIHEFIERLPGVPIFFTVSGFLVFWSLERNQKNLFKFFKNRFLRVYPGLWMCLIVTVILLFTFQAIELRDFKSSSFYLWLIGQLTIFQFYTPDFLRDFGVGTPNGSLWTITVEVQFYLILPILSLFILKIKKLSYKNVYLFCLIFISLVFAYLVKIHFAPHTTISKIANVTVLTYLYNFIFGILIYVNWDFLKKYLINKSLFWFVFYLAFVILFYFILGFYGKGYVPNIFGIISFLLLSILTISAAYSKPNLSFVLRGNDISYGVYIYHMLVINTLIELMNSSPLLMIMNI